MALPGKGALRHSEGDGCLLCGFAFTRKSRAAPCFIFTDRHSGYSIKKSKPKTNVSTELSNVSLGCDLRPSTAERRSAAQHRSPSAARAFRRRPGDDRRIRHAGRL